MTLAEELQRDADIAEDGGGMYYSGQYLQGYADRARSLEAYNAKLRELVKNLHACNGSCPRCVELMGKCEYEEQLAELGIEVGE